MTAGGPPPPAPGLFEAYEAIRVGSWPEAVAVGDVTGGRDRTSPATGARTSLSRAGRGRRGGLPAVGRRHARLRGRDADRQQQQGPDRPVERRRVPRRRRGRVGNEHRQRPPQRRERPPSRPGHPRGATRWVRRPRDRRRTRRSRRDVGPALRRPEHQRPRAAARAVGSARRPSTSSRTGSVSATSPETGGTTSSRATAATGRPHRSRSSPRRRPEHSTYRGATRATTSRSRSTWRENRGVRSRIDVFWYLKSTGCGSARPDPGCSPISLTRRGGRRRCCGSSPVRAVMSATSLDQRRIAPEGDGLAPQQRHEAQTVHTRRDGRAAEPHERRVEVDVLDDVRHRLPGRHVRAGAESVTK